ncbi:glutaminyl-peptide cyclotransferase [Aridibaculum aurantiacum]|uniref:glutaminyl-peptide cyclotransferase n=1 Tax=Aridibaculum aurantiacum TaxID=2810307 RepID=UPI001A979A2B|nr:glutaminyl-peptide cyclotransferase [Aridibaculum aurantiacum]
MKKFLGYLLLIVTMAACKDDKTGDTENTTTNSPIPAPQNIQYNIVASYPHDTSSYTQGLIWLNNSLFEGTGIEGQSKLLKVDLQTGKAQQAVKLSDEDFGEGITILNDKIYQLTWMNNKVYVYDASSLKKIQEFKWEHQGWGITHNGTDLIISTGSNNLYFVDPATFQIKNVVGVFDNNGPVGNLNELEYIDGSVYSNVYTTDYIIKIDPSSGHVIGRMNLEGLLQKAGKTVEYGDGNVLNGIAYDKEKNSLYITGKKWPLLFELKLN